MLYRYYYQLLPQPERTNGSYKIIEVLCFLNTFSHLPE